MAAAGITYVVGDATKPLVDGEANCPCILLDETTCIGAGQYCYHITGTGICTWCSATGIVLESLEKEWPRALANFRRIAAENRCRKVCQTLREGDG